MRFSPLAGIKPTVFNALIVFVMVVITVPLAKYFLIKYPVPGLTDLVTSV